MLHDRLGSITFVTNEVVRLRAGRPATGYRMCAVTNRQTRHVNVEHGSGGLVTSGSEPDLT